MGCRRSRLSMEKNTRSRTRGRTVQMQTVFLKRYPKLHLAWSLGMLIAFLVSHEPAKEASVHEVI